MILKSLMIIGGLTGLMLAAPFAHAQSNDRRGYCDDYARRVAFRQGDSNAVVGSAVGGAVVGGVIGAVTGQGHASNIATGAAVGGVTGGVIGAAGSQGHINRGAYREAYIRCMNQGAEGYNRPVRFSRGIRYCISRYRSYNPNTGLYMSAAGGYRHCP